jgi:hypothetical protein
MSQPVIDLAPHSVCVLVFVMEGCGACEEYVPRLQRVATPLLQQGLPILIYMADDPRPTVQSMMNAYNIQATPTTVVLRLQQGVPTGEPTVIEGSIDDWQIGQLVRTLQGQFVPPR